MATEGGRHAGSHSQARTAGAPFWAAIITLADQYAGRHLGLVNADIYRIAGSASYHQAFRDASTQTDVTGDPLRRNHAPVGAFIRRSDLTVE